MASVVVKAVSGEKKMSWLDKKYFSDL